MGGAKWQNGSLLLKKVFASALGFFYLLYKFDYFLHSPSPCFICWKETEFGKMLPGAEWVISLSLVVMIRTWRKCWLRSKSKNRWGSILWLANAFTSNLSKNLKIFLNHGGIKDLRDLRENSTNIQKRDRTLRSFVSLRLNPEGLGC